MQAHIENGTELPVYLLQATGYCALELERNCGILGTAPMQMIIMRVGGSPPNVKVVGATQSAWAMQLLEVKRGARVTNQLDYYPMMGVLYLQKMSTVHLRRDHQ